LAHVVVLVVALQKGWSFQSRAAFGIQDGLFKARQQWQTLESQRTPLHKKSQELLLRGKKKLQTKLRGSSKLMLCKPKTMRSL